MSGEIFKVNDCNENTNKVNLNDLKYLASKIRALQGDINKHKEIAESMYCTKCQMRRDFIIKNGIFGNVQWYFNGYVPQKGTSLQNNFFKFVHDADPVCRVRKNNNEVNEMLDTLLVLCNDNIYNDYREKNIFNNLKDLQLDPAFATNELYNNNLFSGVQLIFNKDVCSVEIYIADITSTYVKDWIKKLKLTIKKGSFKYDLYNARKKVNFLKVVEKMLVE